MMLIDRKGMDSSTPNKHLYIYIYAIYGAYIQLIYSYITSVLSIS